MTLAHIYIPAKTTSVEITIRLGSGCEIFFSICTLAAATDDGEDEEVKIGKILGTNGSLDPTTRGRLRAARPGCGVLASLEGGTEECSDSEVAINHRGP